MEWLVWHRPINKEGDSEGRRRTSASSMMNFFRMVAAAYGVSVSKQPLLTAMGTSGSLWCVGDVVTQSFEWKNCNAGKTGGTQTCLLDYRRLLSQTAYATLFWGPAAHKWYHWLDSWCRANIAASRPGRIVAAKVAMEMLVLHPVGLLAYFGIVGSLQGESFNKIVAQVFHDFPPTYLLEIVLWTPIDLLNFAVVPVRHQLLVVNCACLAESIALSYIKHNGVTIVDAKRNTMT